MRYTFDINITQFQSARTEYNAPGVELRRSLSTRRVKTAENVYRQKCGKWAPLNLGGDNDELSLDDATQNGI